MNINSHTVNREIKNDEHILIYVIKGEMKYIIENSIFSIKENDFLFIQKDVYFTKDDFSNDCKYASITVKDDIFEKYDILKEIIDLKVVSVSDSKKHIFEGIIQKIKDEGASDGENSKLLTDIYIAELIALILRYKLSYETKDADITKSILSYINENYAKDISLEAISSYFSLSKCHFSKKFKSNMGIGINEYITSVRISNAEKLLTTTNMSITEVAYRVGYNDSNYFSSVFKKINGITPLKYAKKYNVKRGKQLWKL